MELENQSNVLSTMIEDYFKQNGINVKVDLTYSAPLDGYLITLKENMSYRLFIPKSIMFEATDSVDTVIKNSLEELLSTIKKYHIKLIFNNSKFHLVSSSEIDDYIIIYNPKKVDATKINNILVALEL